MWRNTLRHKIIMELQQNDLQKNFYSFIDGKVVTFYLANMHSVYGKVVATDNFTVLVRPFKKGGFEGVGTTNLIYKSNIVNIEIDEKFALKDYLYKQQHQSSQENSRPVANQTKQNKNQNRQNKVSNEAPATGIPQDPSAQLASVPNPKRRETATIVDSFPMENKDEKQAITEETPSLDIPDINIETTENENTEKIDNGENLVENKDEQAKYSPMSFLNDLQK